MRRTALRCFVLGLALSVSAAVASSDDRTSVAIEALLRLQITNLADNPKLAQAVTNLLEKTRGTPNFVKLVQKFHLTNQTEALLDLVAEDTTHQSGAQAMKLVLAGGDLGAIQRRLQATNHTTSNVVVALASTGRKEAISLLSPLVTDLERFASLRRHAVRGLAQSSAGAAALLELARENKLPDDVVFTAREELNRAPWPEIKAQAAAVLPSPQGQDSQPLPPLAELMKMRGDPAAGARVFSSPSVACANCHRVRGQGIELGPDLSEIGTKLGKDALYEAIIDPNAGISFGYEAWQLTLKTGDEAYGMIASETADEIALKAATGIVNRYKKSEIAGREQMKLSIMPAGLQQAMTVQELVDLVEYLSSLRKEGK